MTVPAWPKYYLPLVIISRTWLALRIPALAIPGLAALTVLCCAASLRGEENGDPLVCDCMACQRFARNYATRNLTPPRVPTPRQRLWSARLCGHVGCCAVS
jgi:hypothetical protein